jgi:hypothetical protein
MLRGPNGRESHRPLKVSDSEQQGRGPAFHCGVSMRRGEIVAPRGSQGPSPLQEGEGAHRQNGMMVTGVD